MIDGVDINFTVAALARPRSRRNGFDNTFDEFNDHNHFHSQFRQEIGHILHGTINIGMALLATVPLRFIDSKTRNPQRVERVMNCVKPKGLYDGYHHFHLPLPSLEIQSTNAPLLSDVSGRACHLPLINGCKAIRPLSKFLFAMIA
jgi:hypothetical protein